MEILGGGVVGRPFPKVAALASHLLPLQRHHELLELLLDVSHLQGSRFTVASIFQFNFNYDFCASRMAKKICKKI